MTPLHLAVFYIGCILAGILTGYHARYYLDRRRQRRLEQVIPIKDKPSPIVTAAESEATAAAELEAVRAAMHDPAEILTAVRACKLRRRLYSSAPPAMCEHVYAPDCTGALAVIVPETAVEDPGNIPVYDRARGCIPLGGVAISHTSAERSAMQKARAAGCVTYGSHDAAQQAIPEAYGLSVPQCHTDIGGSTLGRPLQQATLWEFIHPPADLHKGR